MTTALTGQLRGPINKRRAGTLLLDVGRNPGNRGNIASGFVGLLFLTGGPAGLWREFTFLYLALATLGATCIIALNAANAAGDT